MTDLRHVNPLYPESDQEPFRLPAGNALDLPLIGAERERVEDMAAYPALVVAERRYRLDPPDQAALRALPDQRYAVGEFGQRKVERLHRRDPVAAVESRFELAEAELLALEGRSHFRSGD